HDLLWVQSQQPPYALGDSTFVVAELKARSLRPKSDIQAGLRQVDADEHASPLAGPLSARPLAAPPASDLLMRARAQATVRGLRGERLGAPDYASASIGLVAFIELPSQGHYTRRRSCRRPPSPRGSA